MSFYAFDSFDGLPVTAEASRTGFAQFEQGEFSCAEKDFLTNIRRNGVDLSKVVTVPGWFSETLRPENPQVAKLRNAAVIWIDCDLYESTVPVLRFITPYLQPGTVVVFDDWYCYRADPQAGEQLAFREWLAAHPEFIAIQHSNISWHGAMIIIQRSSGK